MPGFTIHRVNRLDITIQPWRWLFADGRRAEIDAHFAALRAKKPALWNGRVLLGRKPVFADGCFRARYFETDFASFIAWRDWGFPDANVFNGFGMGALRGNDGVFVLGEMATHTATAGRIYFPSGTPDLDDVRGDVLDLADSIAREVEEETGLAPSDYRADPVWYCVAAGPLIAIFQLLNVDMPGAELKERIAANLAAQADPELSAMHCVSGPQDINAAMPRFVTAFIAYAAGQRI